MTSLQWLADDIMQAQRAARLAENANVWEPHMTPVSSLGYQCVRRHVYHRLYPRAAEKISVELASIFEEGHHHEKQVRAELTKIGYEVVETESSFRDQQLDISGKIDGKVTHARLGRRRVPVEIKALAGGIPTTTDQWVSSESDMLKRYRCQLTTYLYLTEEPDGLGLFKNKMNGLWSVVPLPLDYSYAEQICKHAERIRDAVKLVDSGIGEQERKSLLPDRMLDRSECAGCPWRDTMCHPDDADVDPILLAKDESLLVDIIEHERLDGPRRDYDKIHKRLQARFKATKGARFMVGGHDEGYVVEKKITKVGMSLKIKRLET